MLSDCLLRFLPLLKPCINALRIEPEVTERNGIFRRFIELHLLIDIPDLPYVIQSSYNRPRHIGEREGQFDYPFLDQQEEFLDCPAGQDKFFNASGFLLNVSSSR